MTIYGTNKPLGSTDPKDLFDNAQNLDVAVNSEAVEVWKDRLGKNRKTWYGMEKMAANAISSFGYITIDSFQSGATLTLPNQVLRDTSTGEYYRWDGEFPPEGKVVPAGSSPASSGGIGIGAWISVGDASLRTLFTGADGKGLTDFYGGGGWTGSDASLSNIYNLPGGIHNNASRWRFALKKEELTSDPTLWLDKETQVSRDDGIKRWDVGNIYAALHKVGGSAYAASITGVGRHVAGSGDLIGVHGRTQGYHGAAKVFGGWFYAAARRNIDGSPVTENVTDLIGVEINMVNQRGDVSYTPATGKGEYRGLIVNTADASGTAHVGVDIGAQLSSGSKPWYVGLRVRSRGIVAFDQPEGDRAVGVLVEGSNSLLTRYGGIALRGTAFDYGLDMSEITTIANNAAIVLKDGHAIKWGSKTSSRYLSADSTTALINANNYSYAVNGVKVLGQKVTGIFSLTGTADGASKNTETMTLQELARYVKKLADAAINHGFVGPT